MEETAGQWQGSKDNDGDRAWGLAECAKRAGQGAYFDWVVGNAILPAVDPNPEHVGIQKVDRKSIQELSEIVTQAQSVQMKVDEADRGLNPLGLAKGVVPFDIDPSFLDVSSTIQGLTHFEQGFQRADKSFGNAVATFKWKYAHNEAIWRQLSLDDDDTLGASAFERLKRAAGKRDCCRQRISRHEEGGPAGLHISFGGGAARNARSGAPLIGSDGTP